MKKIVLTFGTIAGLICGGMFFLNMPKDGQIDFSHGVLTGYITMIIAFSTIFFAVRQYRDQHSEGKIKFSTALLIGIYVTVIASVIYVIAWEIFFTNFASDYGDQYLSYLEGQMSESGMSQVEIDEELASSKSMMDSYGSNIVMRIGLTFLEIFPVGLIISILNAFVFGKFLKGKTA